MPAIRIGTRGSKLALWQAEWVATQLRQRGEEVELVEVATQGDVTQQSLRQVGGQGIFTKAIQQQLLENNVDVAVHSLKDLPTERIEGLSLAAIPERETTRDCLISRGNTPFEQLDAQARVGTGSARRGAQLLAWRSDVEIADIRGNVDSRIRKLEEGQYDAIVLAAAGLRRLRLFDRVSQELPHERILPAIGQGALGLECRTDDENTREALAPLNHAVSWSAVTAERQLLASLLAGCLAPVAAFGQVQAGVLKLVGRVIATDGSKMIEGECSGSPDEPDKIGAQLAKTLKAGGADELIELARTE